MRFLNQLSLSVLFYLNEILKIIIKKIENLATNPPVRIFLFFIIDIQEPFYGRHNFLQSLIR